MRKLDKIYFFSYICRCKHGHLWYITGHIMEVGRRVWWCNIHFDRNNQLHLILSGRVTHICVGNLTIIGSDNGFLPGRHQAIIWTNAGVLIGPSGTNFSEILIEIHAFSFNKIVWKCRLRNGSHFVKTERNLPSVSVFVQNDNFWQIPTGVWALTWIIMPNPQTS